MSNLPFDADISGCYVQGMSNIPQEDLTTYASEDAKIWQVLDFSDLRITGGRCFNQLITDGSSFAIDDQEFLPPSSNS